MYAQTMHHAHNGRDPDEAIVAVFGYLTVTDDVKSQKEGRPVCEDIEICTLRYPGRKDWQSYPSTAQSHWAVDPETGQQRIVTYAERFARQYRQWKENQTQTKSGTPLTYAVFLTEARRAEMRALNIYTMEALAAVDGNDLKNLGPNGREFKNKAEEYIAESKKNAPNIQMLTELEALRARNDILEADMKMIKEKTSTNGNDKADSVFDDMTTDQIRDLVAANTGHMPVGTLNRKTLIRMANEAAAR